MTGRNRRLLYEYESLVKLAETRNDILISVERRNQDGFPVEYKIIYNIKSICGVAHLESLDDYRVVHTPLFAEQFTMLVTLPPNYPCVDAQPQFQFVGDIKPWHPNIRFFGPMAGHVCINQLNTFTDIAWGVERVALYLRYELYHAIVEPPYPEDLKVASWVRHEGEPNEWVFFDQV